MDHPDDFTQYYASLLEGTYDCVDRIVLNAYFSRGQSPGGFRSWWREWAGSDDGLDTEHLMRFAGRFSRRLRAWAAAHGVPVIDCNSGERKHELAEAHLPPDPAFVGVFLIQVSRGPALVWDVRRFGQGGLDLRRKAPWPYVKHYSFHIIDPDWGHLTMRLSGHPPFGALIMLNGHEWVERRARQRQLPVTKEGNCFTHTTDVSALAEVADALTAPTAIGRLAEVCDRWIYSACLCFGLSQDDQERSGFRYDYSAYQVEYSRNLCFQRGGELRGTRESLCQFVS